MPQTTPATTCLTGAAGKDLYPTAAIRYNTAAPDVMAGKSAHPTAPHCQTKKRPHCQEASRNRAGRLMEP